MAAEDVRGTVKIIDAIVAAHENGDGANVRAQAHTLHQQIRKTGERLAEDDWQRLFKTLKNGRVFDYMRALAELLVQVGHDENRILCFYAQGLTEGGKMTAACSMLAPLYSSAMAKLGKSGDERKFDEHELEAVGLIGRAHKQSYIEFAKRAESSGDPLPEAGKNSLGKAIRTYGSVLASGSQSDDGWQEINYVALAKLGERLGVIAHDSSGADQIAYSLIKRLSQKARDGAAGENPWPAATVGEAYLAFEKWDDAAKFYGLFASHNSISAFNLGSAIRQLEEIWQIDQMVGLPRQILTALRAKLVSLPGGELEFPSGTIQSLGDDLGIALEAVFGKAGPLKVEWFEAGIKRARSVARILVNNKPLGTGFLVSGKALSPLLEDKSYLLTNSHVLSDPRAHYLAKPPRVATVVFEEARESDQQRGFGCRMVWQSGYGELDAVLLELEPDVPKDLEPCPIADQDLFCDPDAYARGEAERVSVIGHPGTEKLSISVQDNQVLDVGAREEKTSEDDFVYYHYKSPTRPGNSGSPVCHGDQWIVYALHHAGAVNTINENGVVEGSLPKLRGREGHYEGNEGISIVSIKKRIHAELMRKQAGAVEQDQESRSNSNEKSDPAAHAAE